jgi:hypothetical protein
MPSAIVKLAFFLLLTAICSACGGGGGTSDSPQGSDGSADVSSVSRIEQFAVGGDTNGHASFTVPDGTTKFTVTAETASGVSRIVSITRDDGAEYVDLNSTFLGAVQRVSLANEFVGNPVSASVPSRDVDPPLRDGFQYTVKAESDPPNQAVTFTVTASRDGDLTRGTLAINLIRVGEITRSAENLKAVEAALEIMRQIYHSQLGVSLNVREFDIDGPLRLPLPIFGSEYYLPVSTLGPSPAINMVIAGALDYEDSEFILGVAGGIPGPPIPSRQSAVTVSLIVGAGADGEFSESDLVLLGQTMAHEAGHFLGLFHPIEIVELFEFSAIFVNDVDALEDTPICFTIVDCLLIPGLNSNLMYPSPIPNFFEEGTNIVQETLTPQQRAVVNRYVAID